METRYGVISRAKIHRLQAGKGVKKNGMYLHDRAASFESLPPGPDPKSVAKDLHQCLPKLTQRGTFFGATQATVDQRHKEFSAFINALFEEDVPSLIKELREDRVIRDFFGYWRRDYDLALKEDGRRPRTAPFDSVRNMSFISSFFSTSSVSLSTPRADLPPISPRSASLSQRSHTPDSILSLPDADSVLSAAPKPPSSAPARLGSTFQDRVTVTSDDEDPSVGRKISTSFSNSHGPSPPSSPLSHNTASTVRRAHSNRSKNSPSPRSETFNVASDFPMFLSSSTRDLLPTSRPPHSPSYTTPGLGTLPENSVLDSSAPNTPLTLRGRTDFNTKRANRNVVIFPDTDEVSSSEGDVLEGELLTPVDGADFNVFVGRSTSCSSPPPSSTFSDLSSQSDGSSWRTSSEQTWPSSASSNDSESGIEIDFPHMTCPDSLAQLEGSLSPPTASSSISTLRSSLYGRRRRSLSQPLAVGSSIPTDVGEEDWSDQGEDLMEAYLGCSQSIFAPNVRDSLSNYDDVPSDFPLDIPDDGLDSSSVISFSTSRERIPSIYGPPRALHRPRPSETTLTRPPSSQSSRAMSITSSRSAAMDDTLVVKAVLDDVKVVLRVQWDAPLTELRQRVLEKFSQIGGTLLRGKIELSYLPAFVGGAGRNRTSTVSSMSTTSVASVDWASALPLRNESDWATAIASCGSKITLRVTCRPTPPPKQSTGKLRATLSRVGGLGNGHTI
jgi:hypothetical protein